LQTLGEAGSTVPDCPRVHKKIVVVSLFEASWTGVRAPWTGDVMPNETHRPQSRNVAFDQVNEAARS
jgi:hypothetical protein